MALDARIPLGVQPPQINDPMQVMGQIQQQRGQQQAQAEQSQIRQLQIQEHQQGVAKGQAEQIVEQRLRELFGGQTPPAPAAIFSAVGPERGAKIVQGLAALQTENQKQYASQQELLKDKLAWMDALPEGVRAESYPAVRQNLLTRGLITDQDAPEQYDPAWFQQVLSFGQAPAKPAEPYTLSPGSVRFGADNAQVASVPTKPENPPPLGGFEDYLTKYAAERKRPVQTLSTKDIEAARKAYNQSDDAAKAAPVTRFQAKEILNDLGKPISANYDSVTGVYTDADGKRVNNPRPVPSAMEMMDSRKFQKAAPVISAMSELSEKINTGKGIIAKISGSVEKAKAQANYNDDVAEYEALISGFTPMVARALGHTGVLTQQDVDSVKALFPQPGNSKSLRDRKVARLKDIIGQLEGTEVATGTAAPDGAAPAPAGGVAPTYRDYLNRRKPK